MLANDTNETFGSFTINIYTFVVLTPPLSKKRRFGKSGGGDQPFIITPNASDDFDPFLRKIFPKIFLKI